MTYQEYFDILQSRLIPLMENQLNPWQRPWDIEAPHNGITGRAYHGANALMLGLIQSETGDPRWYTYKQAREAGGQVRKGEKAIPLFLFSTSYQRSRKDEKGNVLRDADGNPVIEDVKTPPVFKVHYVFNGSQITDLSPFTKEMYVASEADLGLAEHLVRNSASPLRHHYADRAYYDPQLDKIYIPTKDSFPRQEEYYSTTFHEMIHSTGIASRLNRPELKTYATDLTSHAREELVAEVGAVTLCEKCDMRYAHKSSAAYLHSWSQFLSSGQVKLQDLYSSVSPATRYVLAETKLERQNIVSRYAERSKKREREREITA